MMVYNTIVTGWLSGGHELESKAIIWDVSKAYCPSIFPFFRETVTGESLPVMALLGHATYSAFVWGHLRDTRWYQALFAAKSIHMHEINDRSMWHCEEPSPSLIHLKVGRHQVRMCRCLLGDVCPRKATE